MRTSSARERLRLLGQHDLGAWIEIATERRLWTVQKRISQSVSGYRSKTCVPSCNASGKTHLAGRLALAFFDAFTPGTPCIICKGPCRGSKIITTSSKAEHLKDNLWGEIRMAHEQIDKLWGFDGDLPPKDTFLTHRPDHFIIGQNAEHAEGFQGYHAAHKLIIGDEATSVTEEVSQGITSLLSSGDSRLLLIFNPTTDDTYAARMTASERTETIKITAFDTPFFTKEEMPEGANLIGQDFLDDLIAQGMGPGSYEWTTRVLADFWGQGDDTLISNDWYKKALETHQWSGSRQLGVDIAPYGSSENVIVYRDGNTVRDLQVFPAMRPDLFFQGPVTNAIKKYDPDYLVYDADGVGSGAIGYAEQAARNMRTEAQMIPFRGSLSAGDAYNNTRSAWWWNLRRNFEWERIALTHEDPKLHEQLIAIRYSIVTGHVRVETKAEMKKRGMPSPDRGDALMYAFAMNDDLPMPTPAESKQAEDTFGVSDYSEKAMWNRRAERADRYHDREPDAVFGIPYD